MTVVTTVKEIYATLQATLALDVSGLQTVLTRNEKSSVPADKTLVFILSTTVDLSYDKLHPRILFFTDGTIFKGCIKSRNYQKQYDQNQKTHKGLDSFTYMCNESLCNNRTLEDDPKDRLKCIYCREECDEIQVVACTEKQDTCYTFDYKSKAVALNIRLNF